MYQEKKYLLKCSIILVVSMFLIDFAVGKMGDVIIQKLPDYSEEISKENFRLNRVRTDIVILGSSRGMHHYVSEMLRDSINNYLKKDYSLYNASMDGHYVNSNLCAMESIMGRYSPKLVILDLSEGEFDGWVGTYDIELAAMHYSQNVFVKKYLDQIGWQERLKVSSNMFRYNQSAFRILNAFLCKKNEDWGYEPLYGSNVTAVNSSRLSEEDRIIEQINQNYLENFIRTIETANKKMIPLFIVTSPSYNPSDNNNLLAKLCDSNGIAYLDLYNLDFFNSRPDLFWDKVHLNEDGALLFTRMLYQQMKQHLIRL